jgi:hypothetical protein
MSITFLIVRNIALKYPEAALSATLDNSQAELGWSGPECLTKFYNMTAPILNCFSLSEEIGGSASLGRMTKVFGDEGVLKTLVVYSRISLKIGSRFFSCFCLWIQTPSLSAVVI